tara:strand:+ start:2949 stop:3104 length:156 start_codon:yes stop_codon:yes gene_type:complete
MPFKPGVAGSSPVGAMCSVAQSVEHRNQPTHSEQPTNQHVSLAQLVRASDS